jgi:hypothetical protein
MPRRPEVLLGRIVDAFRTLLRVVESEPELVAFLPAARELYGQVRALHRGEREIPKFSKGGAIPIMDVIPQLPSKDAALLLLGPIDRIPECAPARTIRHSCGPTRESWGT